MEGEQKEGQPSPCWRGIPQPGSSCRKDKDVVPNMPMKVTGLRERLCQRSQALGSLLQRQNIWIVWNQAVGNSQHLELVSEAVVTKECLFFY